MTEYRATVRRPGRFLVLFLLCFAGLGLGLYRALLIEGYNEGARALVLVAGGFVVALLLSMAHAFRAHLWRLEAEGLRIREGPRVPLTGLVRRDLVAWGEIAGLETSGLGALRTLRVITRDGRRFDMAQRMVADPTSRFQGADPAALLEDLEAAIRARVAAAGAASVETLRGLSFLETRVGLGMLAGLLLVSLPLSVATIWALWHGATPSQGYRSGYEAVALFLILPAMSGWLLVTRLRARRAILKGRRDGLAAGGRGAA